MVNDIETDTQIQIYHTRRHIQEDKQTIREQQGYTVIRETELQAMKSMVKN